MSIKDIDRILSTKSIPGADYS